MYEAADLVILNTQGHRRLVEGAFAEALGKILVIPNGFRERDFDGLDLAAPARGRLSLTFAGSLYPGYDASPLIDRLNEVVDRHPSWRERLSLTFVGKTAPHDHIERARFPAERRGYVPQIDALRELLRSHASVLIVPDRPGAELWVPQKLYTYLRVGRPILCVGRGGEVEQILRDAGGPHLHLSPRADTSVLVEWLEHLDSPAVQGMKNRDDVVRRYDRRAQAGLLAESFNRLVKDGRRG
ncbi:MAG: glycosyltransferase family 4 protein [Myxococcales bacterium]|nr:glycosyltransferase family 4 protein [Myxococcales bacterium]